MKNQPNPPSQLFIQSLWIVSNKGFKNFLFCLFFVFGFIHVQAQKVDIVTGDFVYPKGAEKHESLMLQPANIYTISRFLGANSHSFYISSETKGGKMLTCYDLKTLKKSGEITVILSDNKSIDAKADQWVFSDSKFTVYYTLYGKNGDLFTFNVRDFDLNGKPISEERMLITSNCKKEQWRSFIYYTPIFSQDKSKLLVLVRNIYAETKQTEMQCWLLDENRKKTFDRKIVFPYSTKDFDFGDICVSNKGEILIPALLKKPTITIKVFRITDKNGDIEESSYSPIKGELSPSIKDLTVTLMDNTRKLAITNLYSKSNKAFGFTHVLIDLESWEADNTNSLISADDLQNILSSDGKTDNEKSKSTDYIRLEGLFRNDAGELKLLCEINSYIATNNGNVQCKQQIIELDVDTNGDLSRTIIIPKYQNLGGENGFIPFQYLNKIYFVYNNDKKNDNDNKDTKQTKSKAKEHGSELVIAYPAKGGEVKKNRVFENPDDNVIIFPDHFYYRIDDRTVITWSFTKEKKLSHFSKITLSNE